MKSLVRIVIIIAIAAILIGGAYAFLNKKNTRPGGSTGNTGSGGGGNSCSDFGGLCQSQGDCCPSLTCKNSVCVSTVSSEPIQAFFLSSPSGGGCIRVGDDGLLGAYSTDVCSWTVPQTTYFWSWDGAGHLIFRKPDIDAGGHVTGVSDMYLIPGTSNGYASMQAQPVAGIQLTEMGSIYNTDYSMCLSPDDTGKLVWGNCLGIPYTFDIITPTNCTTDGECTSDSQCCPPYGSCLGGKCASCYGSPEEACPDPTTLAVCGPSSVYQCQSKCSGSPSCQPNETGVCGPNPDGSFGWNCQSLCQGETQPSCDQGTTKPVCTGSNGQWGWVCPYNPCDFPDPDPSTAPAPPGNYTWDNDHFQTSDPAAPWLAPKWDCHTQTWTYIPGCSQGYISCEAGSQAICSPDTGSKWQCVSSNTNPDLCGLSAPLPGCPSQQCIDVSSCDPNSPPTANNWRWVCPSEADECEIIKYYGYKPLDVANAPGSIYFDAGSANPVPIYPSVLNSVCRSAGASDYAHQYAINLINNPTGSIMGDGSSANPYSLVTPGDRDYVFTNFTPNDPNAKEWVCASPQPCLNGGAYVNWDGSAYEGTLTIVPKTGVVGPPSAQELLSSGVGKCSCPNGVAGTYCEYTTADCGGAAQGTPQTCNAVSGKCNGEYQCNCTPGEFYGNACQYTVVSCHNRGVPDDVASTGANLHCNCTPAYAGNDCSQCANYTNVPIFSGGSVGYLNVWGQPGMSLTMEQLVDEGGNYFVGIGMVQQCAAIGHFLNVGSSGAFQFEIDGSYYLTNQGAVDTSKNPSIIPDDDGNMFAFTMDDCGFVKDFNGNYVYLHLIVVGFKEFVSIATSPTLPANPINYLQAQVLPVTEPIPTC